MKFKLSSGDSSFSFEGELNEAKALLDAYWKPQPTTLGKQPLAETPSVKTNKSKTRPKPTKRSSKGATSSANSIDAQKLANIINEVVLLFRTGLRLG